MRSREAPDGAAGPTIQSTTLDAYLRRLDSALARVPAAERREILLETRSHVVEQARRAPARSVADVLADLGEPEAYAHRFMDEEAPPPPRGPVALRGIGRLATGGWRSLPALLLVLAGYAVVALALLLAVVKLVSPDSIGVWVLEVEGVRRSRFAGVTTEPQAGREVLGLTLVALLLLVAGAIHFSLSALLRRVLRQSERRPTSHS